VAIGEEPNLDFLKDKDPKILIAGDAREILGTVAGAIGQGKEAAAKIEAMIKNQNWEKKEGRVIGLKDLNLDYFSHQKREEKINLYSLAKREAKRCFSCGHCLFCKNCKIFCPDLAIDFEEERPIFNYDYCKGCGICKIECQTGSISMIREV
jgi:2-oxoacid:acceptor oxidoreductase delta subunit (pyruvate/2-ketoisovalerate family)